jgi:hypothetical protein
MLNVLSFLHAESISDVVQTLCLRDILKCEVSGNLAMAYHEPVNSNSGRPEASLSLLQLGQLRGTTYLHILVVGDWSANLITRGVGLPAIRGKLPTLCLQGPNQILLHPYC